VNGLLLLEMHTTTTLPTITTTTITTTITCCKVARMSDELFLSFPPHPPQLRLYNVALVSLLDVGTRYRRKREQENNPLKLSHDSCAIGVH
jgi:hypothetical protein